MKIKLNEKIKFHESDLSGMERAYVKDSLESGKISGRGPHTDDLEKTLQKRLNVQRVLMTTSGTHALEMAVRLSSIEPEDEVLMPSFTFPSTANAVLSVGAKPVFVPVEKSNLCVCAKTLDSFSNPRVKGVVAVHYGGCCNDMKALEALCEKKGWFLIEDSAQAFGSVYEGRALGSYGDWGCFSFHGTKSDICGEGGALAIKNNEKNQIERAEWLLEKGTNHMSFLKKDVSHYQWMDFGSSYSPSDLLMGILRGQLESHNGRKIKRRNQIKTYIRFFESIAPSRVTWFKGFKGEYDKVHAEQEHFVQQETFSNGHLFYVLFEREREGRAFYDHMNRHKIPIQPHYYPLHCTPMGEKLGYKKSDLPWEATLFYRLFRFPVHDKLTDDDIKTILKATKKFFKERGKG